MKSTPASTSAGTSAGASVETSSASAGAGTTSAGKAKKPQKTRHEISLEIKNSTLEDENGQLKGKLSEWEEFAEGLRKGGKQPALAAPADAGLDWEKFAADL